MRWFGVSSCFKKSFSLKVDVFPSSVFRTLMFVSVATFSRERSLELLLLEFLESLINSEGSSTISFSIGLFKILVYNEIVRVDG